ncbi:MAG: HAD-IA family hydrolase [Pseudomonadota bacterium]|nr:HAD-IA family hydrolase [Pseudomonadota bacterium]
MSLRLVIFDCDGTLVDSQYGIVHAMQTAFLSFGLIAPAPEAVKRVVGLSLETAIQTLAPGHGISDIRQLAALYREAAIGDGRPAHTREPMFEGIKAAILSLEQAGYLLGVATGKGRRGLDAMIARHGLANRFVTLQTADSVQAGKPAPDMCLQACAEAGVEPRDAVVIGDTSFDMQMARRAGSAAIGVAWGYHPPAELVRAGAAEVLDHAGQIPDAVARQFGTTEPA